METRQSTCKVRDKYGVEIGKYAIALDDGRVVSPQPKDSPFYFEVVPDDSGTVELSDRQIMLAQSVNKQLEARDEIAAENNIPVEEYLSAPEEAEEGEE